ncbi:hypothetical protein VNO78_10047 [Psophocarpus tetragonolobus]|uniref:Uncharacterized protein n=1 Tax=Psophocarpus tetragonolobus TaxID=3891 RepID=A0AAN9XLW3_PSOTE
MIDVLIGWAQIFGEGSVSVTQRSTITDYHDLAPCAIYTITTYCTSFQFPLLTNYYIRYDTSLDPLSSHLFTSLLSPHTSDRSSIRLANFYGCLILREL